jgi:hypothetical protein
MRGSSHRKYFKNISVSDPKTADIEDGELSSTHLIATVQHAAVLTKSDIEAFALSSIVFSIAMLAHSHSSSYRSSGKERSAASRSSAKDIARA